MQGSLTVKSFQNLLRPWIEECFRIMKSEFQAFFIFRFVFFIVHFAVYLILSSYYIFFRPHHKNAILFPLIDAKCYKFHSLTTLLKKNTL